MQSNRERWLESLIHTDHAVLGRPLQPFCLWHMIELNRIRSPFAHAKEPTGDIREIAAHLLLAAAICAATPDSPRADLTPAAKWPDGAVLTDELAKFAAYRRDYAALLLRYQASGKPVSVPWELAVLARLMRYGRYTKREALTEHFGFAMNLCFALGEANGGDPGVISDTELANLLASGWVEEDFDAS